MTLPVFRSVSSVSYASRGSPIAVAKPAGVVDGDIMIAAGAMLRSTVNTGDVLSAPAGWTSISAYTTHTDGGGSTATFQLWWKRASSEGTSYDWTQNTGGSRSEQIAIAAYSGCLASGSPIEASFSTNKGLGSTATALGITTTVADTLLLVAGHNWDIGGASAITGGTERFDNLVTICDAPQVTAAATGNKTYTSGSLSGDPWQGWMIALKPVAASVPWTPDLLGADLYAWYDASDATKVITTGSGVSQWTDKSVNARHALQTDDTKRPVFSVNSVVFTFFQALNLSGYPAAWDVIFLGTANSAIDYKTVLMGVSELPFLTDNSDPALIGHYTSSGFASSGLTWVRDTTAMFYGSISNLMNCFYSKDGGSLVDSGQPSPNETVVSIGRGDYEQPCGAIFEMIFVTHGVSTAIRQQLEGYMAWKWGKQATLPSDHPYKNAAPTTGAPTATSKVKVWTGSAWVLKPVKVWSGSAWVTKPLKTWNGSAWI